ncbi:DNA-3-methyladenine glycosylase family protein [Clostridium rectalis]|uniref:DNA-3-methyladenine glycosylase family protein n=1 Tax=Clostridium rectalis TaxID=2040295 RepID=UPI000F6320BD|nr:DNA glycosylase [Clostridium rectalis]
MDYNSVEEFYKDGIKAVLIKGVKNFELPHIFECGQCFRWNIKENGNYIGVAFGHVIEVEKKDDNVILYNSSEKEFNSLWVDYFDLKRDYSEIKKILSRDELLKKSVDFGYGIRLLKQDPFELIVSFIISANNRIPMIKKAIKNISEKWGESILYNGNIYYSFPSIENLHKASQEELESCGVGFRGKYIKHTVEKIYNSMNSENKEYDKIFDINWIKIQNDDECHTALQNFIGIGPKVADCIMLFSMGKYSAFPVDVWVKRAMQHFYLAPDVSLKKIRDFARNKFGDLSGVAQQYLFYYARENNILI